MNTCPQSPLTPSPVIQEIFSEELPSDTAFQELFDKAEKREASTPPSLFALIEEKEEENSLLSCGFIPLPRTIEELSSLNTSSVQGVSLSSPLIEALFEKMASSMVIMTSSHEQQTSLVLDTPSFSSSCLFGTRITITEFSTAPKVFNVEIHSNPGAISLIQQGTPHLLATFDKGHFPFTINRLDTHIQPTRTPFVFQRKGDKDHEEQDQYEEQDS